MAKGENKMTIDGLAAMMRRTMASKEDIVELRAEVATKKDLERFATKDDLARVEQKIQHKMDVGFAGVNSRLDLVREDMNDLPTMREELDDFRNRLDRVEQKVGLAR